MLAVLLLAMATEFVFLVLRRAWLHVFLVAGNMIPMLLPIVLKRRRLVEMIGAFTVANGVPEVIAAVRTQFRRGASQVKLALGGESSQTPHRSTRSSTHPARSAPPCRRRSTGAPMSAPTSIRSPGSVTAVERLMGMILAIVAVEMMMTGIGQTFGMSAPT